MVGRFCQLIGCCGAMFCRHERFSASETWQPLRCFSRQNDVDASIVFDTDDLNLYTYTALKINRRNHELRHSQSAFDADPPQGSSSALKSSHTASKLEPKLTIMHRWPLRRYESTHTMLVYVQPERLCHEPGGAVRPWPTDHSIAIERHQYPT